MEDEPEPGSGRAGSHARGPLGMWTDDDLTELYCTLLPVTWDVVGNSGLTVTLGSGSRLCSQLQALGTSAENSLGSS